MRFSTGLLSLLIHSALVVVADLSTYDAVVLVSDKLESKCDYPNRPSSLTFQDLLASVQQSQTWTKEAFEAMREASSMGRMVADFAIIPTIRFQQIFGHSTGDELFSTKYIARLETIYCKFIEIYRGKRGKFYAKSPRTDELLYSITDVHKEGKKPLSKKLIRDASFEYSLLRSKIDEIVYTEDIFAHLDEYELLLNYINRLEVMAMVESVFPFLNQIKTDQDLVTLKREYNKALNRRGLNVEKGSLISRI